MGKFFESLASVRKEFHRYPERAWREFWTASKICIYLHQMGYRLEIGRDLFTPEYRINVPDQQELDLWYQKAIERGAKLEYLEKMKDGYCGIVATFDTQKKGPTFAFESELDALPGVTDFELGTKLIEESVRPLQEGWASENEGIMHACGHDVHITMALGIAEYIVTHQESLSGKYVFLFTPAEEGGHGAKSFADLPIMKEIDYYFAYHVGVKPLGTMMLASKIYLRSIEQFKVTLSMKPQSNIEGMIFQKLGSEFQQGKIKSQKDFVIRYLREMQSIPANYSAAVKASANIIQGLDQITPRSDGYHQIYFSNLNQGINNVSFEINLRADNNDLANYLSEQARKLVKIQANLFDLDLVIEDNEAWHYPAWARNDPDLVELAKETWLELGLGDRVIDVPFGEMGSDDDVYLMNKITANGGKCFYSILISDNKQGQIGELHSAKMDIDDELMETGVNLTVTMMKKLCQM